MLNTLALVAALVLSVAFSLPGSIGFDEVINAIDRFSEDSTQFDGNYFKAMQDGGFAFVPYGGDNPKWAWWMWTTRQMTMSITSLGLTLIVVIFIYFFMAATTFLGPDGKSCPILLNAWWMWIRPAVMFVFVTLIIGIVCLFNSLTGIYLCKFPDKWWQHTGTYSDDGVRSVIGYLMNMSLGYMMGGMLIFGVFLPSFGLAYKNWKGHKLQVDYNLRHGEKTDLERWLEACRFPSRPSTGEENTSAEIYLERFKEAEIMVDQILLLSEAQLQSIGVPLGHALLIIGHCDALKAQETKSAEETDHSDVRC